MTGRSCGEKHLYLRESPKIWMFADEMFVYLSLPGATCSRALLCFAWASSINL